MIPLEDLVIINEVNRRLARHSPRAEANKAISCNGIGKGIIPASQVRLRQKGGYMGVVYKKMIFGPKKEAVFGPKSIFCNEIQIFCHHHAQMIMTGHQKGKVFVLNLLHSGRRGGRRGPFLARKYSFFCATSI